MEESDSAGAIVGVDGARSILGSVSTGSTDSKHGLEVWTGSMDLKHGLEAWTGGMDLKHGLEVWT